MDDEKISIESIQKIFSLQTGSRTIEVTEGEYQTLLAEATEKRLDFKGKDDSFTLNLGHLTLTIVCEYDDDE